MAATRGNRHLLLLCVLMTMTAACSSEPDAGQSRRVGAGPVPTVAGLSSAGPTGSPPATPPAGSAPAKSFAVGVRQLNLNRGGDRPLPVTVWYPATGTAGGSPRSKARTATGRFPLVLFSHGLSGRPADYTRLLTRWAAAGLVVAAPRYPHTSPGGRIDPLDVLNQPADASYVITEVLALDTRDDDGLRGHLSTDRVAAAGHSAGGITTVGMFTTARDERLDGGIVLAGSSLGFGTGFTGTAVPMLFVHGKRDTVVEYDAGRQAYDAVPWPKAMMSLPEGDHAGSLSRGEGFEAVAATTTEFLRWTLFNDPKAKRRLAGAAEKGDVATLQDKL